MSLVGLVNLAERLFNQTQGNLNEDGSGPNRSAKTAQPAQKNAADEFRPSGGSAANEAGLFQVTQQSVFTGAASVLLVQPSGATTGGANAAASETPAVSPAPATQASATTNSGGVAAAATATTQSADNAQVLAQLQSLNTSLAALGLSADEIAAVDRVAQLIKDFSPAAFTSLINQLQALAQDSAQPATTSANAANASRTQTGGGFSIQELSIKFAGVNETVQQGGNTLQISAFQLQVSEVNLTLNNGATGQTTQIQTPQPAPNTASGATSVAKAAAA